MWLEPIGVVSGCFPHITCISLLHLYLFFFAAASLLLFSFLILYMSNNHRVGILYHRVVDSISRDEPDVPLTQYITNA